MRPRTVSTGLNFQPMAAARNQNRNNAAGGINQVGRASEKFDTRQTDFDIEAEKAAKRAQDATCKKTTFSIFVPFAN